MTKLLNNKFIALLVGILILIWFINTNQQINNKEHKIKKTGYYLFAIILNKDAGKGGTRNIEYKFNNFNNYYSDRSYIDDIYFKKLQIGDTIIIKTHKDLLPYSIVCENLVYKSCMGKPPKEGWKELPKCK